MKNPSGTEGGTYGLDQVPEDTQSPAVTRRCST